MAGDGGSAVFRAIADFAQLFRETRKAKKEMKDLAAETGRTNKELGDTDTQAQKSSGSLGRLSGSIGKMTKSWDKFNKSDAGKTFHKIADAGDRLGTTLHGIRGKLVGLSALAVGATAAIGPVLGLVGAAVSLSGAVGVLPGLMVAAGVGSAVLKVAFSGVSEVLKNLGERDAKKFADSIKDLPAPMQKVAKAAWDIYPALDNIKKSIQSRFWAGLEVPLRDIAGKYLPMLGTQGGAVATTFNKMAKEFGSFLGLKSSVSDVNAVLGNTNGLFKGLVPAIKPISQALLDVVKVSSEFLPGLGKGIAGVTTKFAEFIHGARESGKLKEWIQVGLDALRDLGAALFNVGRIFVSIFNAGKTAGKGFFDTLKNITDRVATFLESAKGQEALAALFDAVAAAGAVLMPILEALFLAFAQIAPILVEVGEKIGPGVVDLIHGLGAAIVSAEPQLIAFGQAIGQLLSAIGNAGPLLNTIIQAVIWAAAPLGVLAFLISTVAGWFAKLPGPVQTVIGVLLGFGLAGLSSLIIIGKLAGGIMGLVGSVGKGIGILAKLVPALKMVGVALRALGAAAMANPIIIIIAAIAAIALLIILNWDTVKQWIAAFWSWLTSTATAVWGAIVAIWNGIVADTMAAWQSVLDFLTMIWNWIKDLVVGTATAVWDFLTMVWNGIVSGVTTAWNAVVDAIRTAWNWISDVVGSAVNSVTGLIGRVVDFLTGIFKSAWDGAAGVVDKVVHAIGDSVQWVVDRVRDAVQWIKEALSNIGSAISTAVSNVGEALNPLNWFSRGGLVGGKGKGDTVPSMLSPGEYVVPAETTAKWLPFLRGINPYDRGGEMAPGDLVNNVAGGRAVATRMASDTALAGARAPRGGDGAAMGVGTLNVNMLVNNPLPEKPSETASKKVGRAAQLGMNAVLGGAA